jgi:hypothetical protein
MKRLSIISMVVAILLTAVPSYGAPLENRFYQEASWEEQARSMIYLILHLSSINAVNGMNLTQVQAAQLRLMALEVEAAAEKIPDLKAKYRPDLAEVRDTYLEVRKYIISGKKVPDELEKRVVKARGIESSVIRYSLRESKWARSSCLRCHTEPNIPDIRSNKKIMTAINKTSCPIFTGREKETFFAHMGSVFGKKGMLKLKTLSPKVDQLLTDSQKEILRTFTCCLTPPKDLSDPIRAGQATSGEREIEILRAVRKVPTAYWPYARSRALKKLELMLIFKYPGITEEKIKTICDRVGEVYDKARALSDVDFEMDKGTLAAEIKSIGGSKKELGKRQQDYMNALFLLIPGTAEVYDNIIKRMNSTEILNQ